MIKIQRFVFSPFGENTYVVWDDVSKESAIIDPGCSEKHEVDRLKSFVGENKLVVKYLINTHCHIDHIFGNACMKETYDVDFYAPEEDVPLLEAALDQAKMFEVKIKPSPKPDKFITEETEIKLGNVIPKFLFTPGHTPGEYCIYFPDEKICITGDVLFKESIGRTDLWKGDYDTLMISIRTKLLPLPDDVTIYPGHGEESTIGYERANNPFLKEQV